MAENTVQQVDDLAAAIGNDMSGVNAMLAKISPEDAESLQGKELLIFGSSTSKKTGYLSSDVAASYKSGAPAGTSVPYIIKDAAFTLETPNTDTSVNGGGMGSMELHINDSLVDSFDLGAAFDATKEGADQTYTPANSASGKITIASVGVYNSIWQKVVARVNIASADLVKGYNSIILKHVGVTGGDQSSQVFDVFYDDAVANPSIGSVSLAIHSNSVPKHLSGVKFLGQGDQVKVGALVNALFDNTYVTNPLDLYGFKGAPTATIAPTDGAVSGVSNPPVAGEAMTLTDKIITLSSSNQCSANGRMTARPRDPFGTYGTLATASQNMLVSTFGNRSSATVEYFDDENYRLPLGWNADDKASSVTGNWDSQVALASGNAQQYVSADNEHSLMYPYGNFSAGYLPANTADYSGFSGDQKYMRALVSSGSKSSIALTLSGVAGGIGQVGSSDVNVEIKLPTQTGWLDCAKAFDSAAGVSADGDGCLAGSISYSGGNATINATFGGKVTYDSGSRAYVRVTLRNGNRFVKQIGTNW